MKKIKYVVFLILGILAYLVLGAVFPYIHQPDVSEQTKADFKKRDFYGDDQEGETAKIVWDNEDALESRIRLIEHAKKSVVVSSFEFHADTSGKQVMAALQAAADRGVEVRVIADGFPAILSMVGNEYFRALQETENVEIRLYNPVRILKPWKLMSRLHDKYLIADDEAYIMGGRNTFDFFLGNQDSHKNYDWDVLVYCGDSKEPSSTQLLEYFDSIWSLKDSKDYGREWFQAGKKKTKKADQELRELYQSMHEDKPDWFVPIIDQDLVPIQSVELLSNPINASMKEPVLFYEMTELMSMAKEELNFHTPYLICNDWMLERLEAICDGDAYVTMMTNSVANNGNPFGAMDYEQHKEEILKTGVHVKEYDDGISYHGKCANMDDDISIVGSFNWDMRSAYLDTEMMLVVHSKELNAQLRRVMNGYEENALTVVDMEESIAPEGVVPQKISDKQRKKMNLIRFVGWARFLM